MPFRSKRQWKAAFAGRIKGLSREQAREWAHETKGSFKSLPDRAPAEKGKPTLRSKKAAKKTKSWLQRHPETMIGVGTGLALGTASNAMRFGRLSNNPTRNLLAHTAIDGGFGYLGDKMQHVYEREEPKRLRRNKLLRERRARQRAKTAENYLDAKERERAHDVPKPRSGTLAAGIGGALTPYTGMGAAVGALRGPKHNRIRRAVAATAGEHAGAGLALRASGKLPNSKNWKIDLGRHVAIMQAGKGLGAAGGNAAVHHFTKKEAMLAIVEVIKSASLGTAVVSSNNVGKLRGMMTSHALKAPGPGPLSKTLNPRKNIMQAMTNRSPR